MTLLHALDKGILKTEIGTILNKFRLRPSRRTTLFFEEILADYVKECEKKGFKNEMYEIGMVWGTLGTQQLVPDIFKELPTTIPFNTLTKSLWKSFGLLDNFHAERTEGIVKIRTENEFITRIIGENEFLKGFFKGCTDAFFEAESDIINIYQKHDSCEYSLKLKTGFKKIAAKEKHHYYKLNKLSQRKGFDLKSATESKFFKLKDNRLFFKERPLLFMENTLLHVISNKNIMLDKVPHISYAFFRKTIDESITIEKKLNLLKTLFQIKGWGNIEIILYNPRKMLIRIMNPPYGLQKEEDNWSFLYRTILGYLWLINKKFKINKVVEGYKILDIEYSL